MHICENACPHHGLRLRETAPHFHFHNHRLSIRRANTRGREEGSPSFPSVSIVARRPNRNVILPSLPLVRCPHSFMRDPRVTGSTSRPLGRRRRETEVGRLRRQSSVTSSQDLGQIHESPFMDPPNHISRTAIAPPHFCVSTQARYTPSVKHISVL